LIECLAGSETDVAQRFLQIFGLDVLVALDLEAFDRRPFLHGDHQRATIAPQLNVAKKTSRIHCAQCFGNAACIQLVADVHRQIVVDSTFGDAL
jgi:hypothetical protein